MSDTSPTVDLAGAADILKVHTKTVEDYIRDGKIAAGKAGRAWVMLRKDVVAYAERLIIEQTADRLQRLGRTASTSPKRGRKVAASKIGVAH